MADFDLFSGLMPVLGTNAGVAFDGTASKTGSVDTLGYRSASMLVVATTAITYANMTLSFEESDDNSTFTAAASDSVIFRKVTPTSTTSRVFHASYIGKKRYIKAVATTVAGTEVGQVTVILGHPASYPVDQGALEA